MNRKFLNVAAEQAIREAAVAAEFPVRPAPHTPDASHADGRGQDDKGLPPLPEPSITAYQCDATMRYSEVRSFSRGQMEDYARAALQGETAQADALRGAEPAGPLQKLLDSCDASDDAQYGTLSTTLVRGLVNEALAASPADSSVHPAVQASLRAIRSAILNGKKSYEVGDVSGGAAWAEVAANRVEEALTPHTPDA